MRSREIKKEKKIKQIIYIHIINHTMNITNDDLRFWIYDAKRTKEFRTKCKQNKLSISQIMKAIDDDHIKITEEKCERKYPRIGEQYQCNPRFL